MQIVIVLLEYKVEGDRTDTEGLGHGGGGHGGGGRGRLYTYSYAVTTGMTPALRWANDKSHYNVSLLVRDKVIRQCPQTTIFEEKGEPKRVRTEVLLFTSRTPYR